MQKEMFKSIVQSFKQGVTVPHEAYSLVMLVSNDTPVDGLNQRQADRKRTDTAAKLAVNGNYVFRLVCKELREHPGAVVTANDLHDNIGNDSVMSLMVDKLTAMRLDFDIDACLVFPEVVGDELDDLDDEWKSHFDENMANSYVVYIQWKPTVVQNSTAHAINIQHFLEHKLS